MLFSELSIFSSFTSHPMWLMTSLAKLLFLDMLFLACLFLAHSKFNISCCTFFNTPSQQERLSLEPDPVTLECSACNTSTPSTCSNNTWNKKHSQLTTLLGQEHTLMLKLYLLLTSAPSLTSALLQHLHASHTIAHLSMPPSTVQNTCASYITAACQLCAILGFPTLLLSMLLHPHLSLANQSVPATPHRGSRSKVSSKRLGTLRIPPLLLGMITIYFPTSYLQHDPLAHLA